MKWIALSKNWAQEGTAIGYNLEVKAFNDIVRRRNNVKRASPLILLLMCLPDDPAGWLVQHPSELLMRRCCYWYVPPADAVESTNKETQKVVVHGAQVLTPEALTTLLTDADQGSLR